MQLLASIVVHVLPLTVEEANRHVCRLPEVGAVLLGQA